MTLNQNNQPSSDQPNSPLQNPNQSPQSVRAEREPLAWLFTAVFADGSTISQDQEDRSLAKEGGSAFTDVLARESELVAFGLNHVDGQQHCLVDVRTGAFQIGDTPFIAHNQDFDPQKYELKLVYFREGFVDQTMDQKTGELISLKQYTARYFIGWETLVNGKKKQVTIAVG
jgi:hypothetical protein